MAKNIREKRTATVVVGLATERLGTITIGVLACVERTTASVPDVVSIALVGVGKEPGRFWDESRELSERFN